jgi:hypothetical protein
MEFEKWIIQENKELRLDRKEYCYVSIESHLKINKRAPIGFAIYGLNKTYCFF